MILSPALANAQVNLAGGANDARLRAALPLVAAHDAIAPLAHVLRKVLAGHRVSRMATCSTLAG
jgi:hypothetical protein